MLGYKKFPIKTQWFGHSILTGWENSQQRSIQTIENARDWRISEKVRSRAISNAQYCTWLMNNAQQMLIYMHSKCTGTHRNTRERMETYRSARKRMGKKKNIRLRWLQMPNKRTNESLVQVLIIKSRIGELNALTLCCYCFCCSIFCTFNTMTYYLK